MAAPCPLLGDGVTDDTLLHIACFLTTAKDLLRLALTCRRFSIKCIALLSGGGGGPASGSAGDAVHPGGGGAAVGGGAQRAGARVGVATRP